MTQDTIRIEIAGVSLTVPVYGDVINTKRLADDVATRIREIEGRSSRIDTQAFALEAAVSFAADLQQSLDERAEDTRDLLRTLDQILTELRALLRTIEKPLD